MFKLALVPSEHEAEREPGLTLSLRITELVDRMAQMRDGLSDVFTSIPVLRHARQDVDRLQHHERIARRFERHPDAVENG